MYISGYEWTPRATPGRLLVGFWWIFVLMTLVTYTAGVVINFLSPHLHTAPVSQSSHISDLSDLLTQTYLKYGTISNGATQSFFQHSTVEVYQKMWATMNSSTDTPFVRSVHEGMDRVRTSKGKYVFIGESAMLRYNAGQPPCDMVVSMESAAEKEYALGVQDWNPLRQDLNDAIIHLKRNGVLKQFAKKWFVDECSHQSKVMPGSAMGHTSSKPVAVADFVAPLVLLSIGIILAVVALIIERYISRRTSKPRKVSPPPPPKKK